MIRATYIFPGNPYYNWIKKGVIYDFLEKTEREEVIYDFLEKTEREEVIYEKIFFDIWLEREYITWCSKSWFERCFTTIADLRDKRIDEILNDD